MDNIKGARIISIFKLLLYCVIEVFWCVSVSRINNLVFIVFMALIILGNILKVLITVINIPETKRIIILIIVWIIELCITTALLTLLYYVNGFDLNDLSQFFVTCFILILCIAETVGFVKFLISLTKSEN